VRATGGFLMNRLPLYGTVIVIGNCGVIVWHLLILARLHSMFSNGQILLIASLVNLIPFTAVVLLWTRFRKIRWVAAPFFSRHWTAERDLREFPELQPGQCFSDGARRMGSAVSNYCRPPSDL